MSDRKQSKRRKLPTTARAQKSRTRALQAPNPDLKAPQPSSTTKLSKILALLSRPQGAALGELVRATGWQRHSIRGALSGAVQKRCGHKLVSDKIGPVRRYRIAQSIAYGSEERRP
jgi:hypothetical protein